MLPLMHEKLFRFFTIQVIQTFLVCRESSAIVVCKHLLGEQAHLAIYDPKVRESQIIK